MGDEHSFYAVLNVGKDANAEEVSKAYRKLAQVFHPDKHTDESKQQHAQEAFSKLQEAYEVLSDTHKRQIYDVYGKAGLAAGLELGENFRSKDELRKQWEEFQERSEQKQQEQSVVQKGSYVFKVDARRLLAGQGLGQGPLFRTVTAQSALEAVLDERNVLSLAGGAAVRPAYKRTAQGQLEEVTLGGGNVVFGYKRVISNDDSLDMSVQVGLQSLISLTSTRQLCHLSGRQGWVNTSWSPQAGVGMQVGCSQQLFDRSCEGSVNVVLGPAGTTGVTTSITKRGNKWNVVCKLEIGMVHSIQARGSISLGTGLTLRAIARLGTTGIDLELGLARRFTPQITGYMAAVVGYPAGVSLKLRASRASQTLECSILMSSSHRDWQMMAVAYIVPPLLYYGISRVVVRPGLAWAKRSRERVQRVQAAEGVRAALAKAAGEQALIEGVALRKAAVEKALSGGGLVVLVAVYGLLAECPAVHTGIAGDAQSPGQATATPSQTDSGSGEAAGGEREDLSQPPAQWVDVSLAVQYLVTDSKLVLHGSVSKAGLMGFADSAPHRDDKELYVRYSLQGEVHEVTVRDTDALLLGM